MHTFIDKYSGYLRLLEYVKPNTLIELGWTQKHNKKGETSYEKYVGSIKLWAIPIVQKCGFLFCPGNILYNDNSFDITKAELIKSLNIVKRIYEEQILAYFLAEDFNEHTISALDVTANLNLALHPHSELHLQEALRILKLKDLSRHEIEHYDTTVSFLNKSHVLKFYHKGAEMKKKERPCAELPRNRYIRMENEFRNPTLKKTSRTKRKSNNFEAVFNPISTKALDTYEHLQLSLPFCTQKEVYQLIEANLGPKQQTNIKKFVDCLNRQSTIVNGGNYAKEIYPKSYTYYWRILRKHNINPIWSDLLVGDKLVPMKNIRDAA